MSDLISRQDAIEAIYERIKQIGYEHNTAILSIRQAVRDLPSAEPEIIRCKDCRHNHNREIQYHAQADDLFYCGWGAEERKEAQAEIKEHIDPERLVQMIRYSSQYNTPCPEWVYKLIEATAYDD